MSYLSSSSIRRHRRVFLVGGPFIVSLLFVHARVCGVLSNSMKEILLVGVERMEVIAVEIFSRHFLRLTAIGRGSVIALSRKSVNCRGLQELLEESSLCLENSIVRLLRLV